MTSPRFIPILLAGVLSLSLAPVSFAKSKASSKPSAKSKPSAAPAAKPSPTASDSDWKVIKIGPRDYLSVDNIAKFYGLIGNVDSTGRTVVLNNGRNMLQVTLDSREAIVNGIRNWFCFPVIAQDNKFLVSRIDLAKTIEPQLRPTMIQRSGKVTTIVLDPGHGGFDKGAANAFGNEKAFALDVARQLRPLLQAKGFKVVMTRENDVFIPLEVRARIAHEGFNLRQHPFQRHGIEPERHRVRNFLAHPAGRALHQRRLARAPFRQHAGGQPDGSAKLRALRRRLSFHARSPPGVRPRD